MVLAGDPQQLGASSRSPVFSLGGFARSLQERLMGLSIYDGCRPSSLFFSFNQANSAPASQIVQANSAPASQIVQANSAPASSGSGDDLGFGVFLTKNYRSHKSIFEVSE